MKKADLFSVKNIKSNDGKFIGLCLGDNIDERQHQHGCNELLSSFKISHSGVGDRNDFFTMSLLDFKIKEAKEGIVAILWNDGIDLVFSLYPRDKVEQVNFNNMKILPGKNEVHYREGAFSNFIEHNTYSYNRGYNNSLKRDIPFKSKDLDGFIELTRGIQSSWDKYGFMIRARGNEEKKNVLKLVEAYKKSDLTISMGLPLDVDKRYYQLPTLCIYSELRKYYNQDEDIRNKVKESLSVLKAYFDTTTDFALEKGKIYQKNRYNKKTLNSFYDFLNKAEDEIQKDFSDKIFDSILMEDVNFDEKDNLMGISPVLDEKIVSPKF